ncbi:MAG: 50S ribosomal protein L19 [Spirochaetales bacterium]|nr:50S ribosomal protein L19 [Spirochaetales bacterium]
MNIIKACETEQMRDDIKDFNIGDTVKVHFKIIEGKTERVQVFEGLCIAKKNSGIRKTFTVRKISYGIGVERTFPLHSPKIVNVETVRVGRVRRAKLYYIRNRVGKAAKVKEYIQKKDSKAALKKSKKGGEIKTEKVEAVNETVQQQIPVNAESKIKKGNKELKGKKEIKDTKVKKTAAEPDVEAKTGASNEKKKTAATVKKGDSKKKA